MLANCVLCSVNYLLSSKYTDKADNECSVYDSSERSWRHLKLFKYPRYIHHVYPG